MKLYIHDESVVGKALGSVASLGGEVVASMDEADAVLCTDPYRAIDLLMAGRRVVLVQVGTHNTTAVDALEKNVRFKEYLSVFRITFGENDGHNMVAFINHCAQ